MDRYRSAAMDELSRFGVVRHTDFGRFVREAPHDSTPFYRDHVVFEDGAEAVFDIDAALATSADARFRELLRQLECRRVEVGK